LGRGEKIFETWPNHYASFLYETAKDGLHSRTPGVNQRIACVQCGRSLHGCAATYDVDLQRLCRVIERITRGLYFEELQARLLDDQRCVTYALDGFSFQNPNDRTKVKQLVDLAFSGRSRVFGQNVFKYWLQQIDGATPATVWAFLVYSLVEFVALTLPRTSA
jgi:hypothetical protein